jgi:hypothetical protein
VIRVSVSGQVSQNWEKALPDNAFSKRHPTRTRCKSKMADTLWSLGIVDEIWGISSQVRLRNLSSKEEGEKLQ